MSKKVLVLDGHNDGQSFCGALAQEYAAGAKDAGHEVRLVQVSALEFDPVLRGGLHNPQPLEQDLIAVQDDLTWCDHVLVVHPLWWGSAPAKLKGLFDRILTSGYAYKFTEDSLLPIPLLGGRQAHVIVTSDTPDEYMFGVYKGAWFEILKNQILDLCGITAQHMQSISPIHSSTAEQRSAWLSDAYEAGRTAA